jgi:hypothetical protein
MCPLLAPVFQGKLLLFFSFLLLWPLTVLMKQTKQAVHAISSLHSQMSMVTLKSDVCCQKNLTKRFKKSINRLINNFLFFYCFIKIHFFNRPAVNTRSLPSSPYTSRPGVNLIKLFTAVSYNKLECFYLVSFSSLV